MIRKPKLYVERLSPNQYVKGVMDGEGWAIAKLEEIVRPRPYLLNDRGVAATQHAVQDLEELQRVLRVSDGRLRALNDALLTGNPEAYHFLLDLYDYVYEPTRCMQFIDSGRFTLSFTPVTNSYTTGSGTEVTPSGAANCAVTSDGGGGGGGRDNTHGAGGGGGSARCVTNASVSSGNSLGYSVGAGGPGKTASTGAGTDGSATTTSGGTGGFAGIAHSAGGGGRGFFGGGGEGGLGGSAGAASGGTTNTNGVDGNAGAGFEPAGGNGGEGGSGAAGGLATAGGGGGGGSYTAGTDAVINGGDGAGGRSQFAFT
jgi:hypothetical protein